MGLGTIIRRLLSDSGCGSIEEKHRPDEDQYMYMFYKFDEGSVSYSLYTFNLSNPDDPQIILELNRDEYPMGMGCVHLGSKVYFIGGQFKVNDKEFTSKKVYVLDLDNISMGLKEAPKMNIGKPNPISVTVNGKIYVFGCNLPEDKHWVSLPHFSSDDMTSFDGFVAGNSFSEVFDPELNEWAPLPACREWMGPYSGFVVVRDVIFLYGDDFTMNCFHLKTQHWEQLHNYHSTDLDELNEDDPHQVLAYTILINGITGRGVVVDDTIFALEPTRGHKLYAYHLLNDLFLKKTTEFHYVSGLDYSFSYTADPLQGSIIARGDLVHLGGYKFCVVSFGLQDSPSYKKDLRFKTFEVTEHHDPLSGEISWSADLLHYVNLATDPGSFIYCFTRFPAVESTLSSFCDEIEARLEVFDSQASISREMESVQDLLYSSEAFTLCQSAAVPQFPATAQPVEDEPAPVYLSL